MGQLRDAKTEWRWASRSLRYHLLFIGFWLIAVQLSIHVLSVVMILERKYLRHHSTFLSQFQHSEHSSSLRAFCSSVRRWGTYLAHTWCLLRSSVKIIYLVDCPKSSSCAMKCTVALLSMSMIPLTFSMFCSVLHLWTVPFNLHHKFAHDLL